MSLFNLSLVIFEIDHEDCWSKLTSSYPVLVKTIFAKPNKGKDYILGMDEVKTYNRRTFKDFLKSFKRDKSIYEIIQILELDNRRGIYRILFKERYENMIMSIIGNYMTFYIKDLIKEGNERLLLIMPSSDVTMLKRDLESIGKIHYFNSKLVNFNDFVPTFFDLSEQERNSVLQAIRLGYYEYPRRINLEELGKIMGISKPTLEEYLRKAEKKIMSKIFREFYQQDLLFHSPDY
ncbi:helix-turn-helix domain-containing protein [Saccharolobus islandicus]|uniref:Bacterio-opsin activator HTH domain protein n=2 Tax=Saccharolobus islandicus TaxID=43080 RepID=C3MV40_SACI4|nr:helix-turn-helix domain-containing protein [Sulfolobus islandicus]ACP37403.1 Bacterio-opsin activator HTH domain protein [Sulfolobus islandicus M.14.25]ACP54554.1 Bacterio-opsin activator HTH domain protein [Sulfolobus islandicus M.16.27]